MERLLYLLRWHCYTSEHFKLATTMTVLSSENITMFQLSLFRREVHLPSALEMTKADQSCLGSGAPNYVAFLAKFFTKQLNETNSRKARRLKSETMFSLIVAPIFFYSFKSRCLQIWPANKTFDSVAVSKYVDSSVCHELYISSDRCWHKFKISSLI